MTGAKALTKKAGIQTVSIPLRGELEATLETLSSSTPKTVGTLQPNGYRLSESKTGSAPQPGLAPSVSPQPVIREHRQVRRRCAGGPHGAAGRYVKTPGPRINPSAPSGVKSRTTPPCQALAARSPKTTIAILVLAVQAVGQPPVDDPVWNDDDHGHRPWDRASTLRSPLPQLRVSSGRTPRCGSVAVHDPDGGSRASIGVPTA